MAVDDPNSTRPIGLPFSHVYVERGNPTDDNPRMRFRLGDWLDQQPNKMQLLLVLQAEMGVNVSLPLSLFFKTVELADILNAVTFAWRCFVDFETASKGLSPKQAVPWLKVVDRIFREQNVSYSVDEKGGVHYSPDQEFARNRQATLSSLSGPRYLNAAEQLENGFKALRTLPPDGKSGIRGIFSSAECVFRLMCPLEPRLTKDAANRLIEPAIQSLYGSNPTALRMAIQLLRSFASWIDGAHHYRHEQGSEEPTQPPLELAIVTISEGAAWVRWLGELDRGTQKATNT